MITAYHSTKEVFCTLVQKTVIQKFGNSRTQRNRANVKITCYLLRVELSRVGVRQYSTTTQIKKQSFYTNYRLRKPKNNSLGVIKYP